MTAITTNDLVIKSSMVEMIKASINSGCPSVPYTSLSNYTVERLQQDGYKVMQSIKAGKVVLHVVKQMI